MRVYPRAASRVSGMSWMPRAWASWRAVVLEQRPWVQARMAVSQLTSASVLRRMRVQPRRSRARVKSSAKCLGSVGLAGVGRHGTMCVKDAPLPVWIKALSCTRYCASAAVQHDLDIEVRAVGHVHQGGEGDVAPLEEIPQGVGGADDHGPLKALVGDRELEAGGECRLQGVPALFASHGGRRGSRPVRGVPPLLNTSHPAAAAHAGIRHPR